MVDLVIVGGAVAVAGVAIAAAYAYLSGDDAEAGVDVDGDGEEDVMYPDLESLYPEVEGDADLFDGFADVDADAIVEDLDDAR